VKEPSVREPAGDGAPPPEQEPDRPREGRDWRIAALAFLLLMAIAIPARIALLREPLNSDDRQYLAAAEAFNLGKHHLQRTLVPIKEGGHVNHHWFRLGLVIPVALALRVVGHPFLVYYGLPFLVAMAAITLTFWLLARFTTAAIALLAGLAQVFNPLEIFTSSVLLTNLLTAVLAVLYVVVFYALPRRGRRWRRDIFVGCVAGLLVGWAYLLRQNAPMLLAPALVVFVIRRPYRRAVLLSIALFAVIVLAEQWLYVRAGGEFGYRHMNVSNAIQRYRPFLAKTDSFLEYVLRYPTRFWVMSRSKAVTGAFCLSILLHVYLIAFSRDTPFRVLTACGLLNLCLYNFGLFAPLSEGFVTMPAKLRFIHLFLMTSVIAVPWGLWHIAGHWIWPLVERLHGRLQAGGRLRVPDRWMARLKKAACWMLLLACSLTVLVPAAPRCFELAGIPLLSLRGNYVSILLGIDGVMQMNDMHEAEIIGTSEGVSAIGIFTWLPPDKVLTWTVAPIEECIELLERDAVPLFVTDFDKMRFSLRYVEDGEEKAAAEARIDLLEKLATERMQPLRRNELFLLSKSHQLK
jgi:hypothetical protein